jgi:hypothetical protein
MVAPEPGELLLLYITATSEVVSVVRVVEQLEPNQPQALKGAPTTGFGEEGGGGGFDQAHAKREGVVRPRAP